ncbi:MAG: hypothetical protein K8S23_16030 [Candidatus Cloacimonetes bacterium]|nr:hypothetical protein [Candidatus Cloacimonadota bacterium]
MKKAALFSILFIITNTIFSRDVILNTTCKADPKLVLQKVELSEEQTILFFKFTNDDNGKRKIGTFAPSESESFYLEDPTNNKIYKITNVEGLPKWWPQEKKFLKKHEVVEFKLIFDRLAPTYSINLIEGEGNSTSSTAWNFLQIIINDVPAINNLIIEYMKKENLSTDESNFVESMKSQYDHISDFVQEYKTDNNWDSYLQKWKNNQDTSEIISFLTKEMFDEIIRNKDADKAQNFLNEYPNTIYQTDLLSVIEQSTLIIQEEEFKIAKEKNTVFSYYNFVEKYCSSDCSNSKSQYIREASVYLDNFFNTKQYELKRDLNHENYNTFLKEYGNIPNSQKIKNDYENFAKYAFEKITDNDINKLTSFLNSYPYSQHTDEVFKRIFNVYSDYEDIDKYKEFIEKYPQSPFIEKMNTKIEQFYKKEEKEKKKMESIENFIDNLKKGDTASYIQSFRITEDSGETLKFDIRYSGKIINILSKTVRIKVISSKLVITETEQNDTILEYFDQIKDITIGNMESVPLLNLEIDSIEN